MCRQSGVGFKNFRSKGFEGRVFSGNLFGNFETTSKS